MESQRGTVAGGWWLARYPFDGFSACRLCDIAFEEWLLLQCMILRAQLVHLVKGSNGDYFGGLSMWGGDILRNKSVQQAAVQIV